MRDNRPTYHPGDPLLRFHYAVIRRHHARLARHDADASGLWRQLRPAFESQVVGPCFQAMARDWVRHFADPATLGGEPLHVGPTTLSLGGTEAQLDVVVSADDASAAGDRSVRAIGEANAGERVSGAHLRRLEGARAALGSRAADAKLLLFGTAFTSHLRAEAARRADVELVDLERLYSGS